MMIHQLKRINKSLLVLITIFTITTGYSQSIGDTFTKNYISYSVTSINPNTVEVTNYNINGGTNLVIPNTVTHTPSSASKIAKSTNTNSTTYNVTTVGTQAILSKGITSLSIPDNIISIGSEAFASNSLTSIIFGNGLQTINYRAFANNQLTDIILPDSLIDIKLRAFETNSISSITIPELVTNIELGAFRYNPLSCIVSKATTPPTISTTPTLNDSFISDRSNISLTIPTGTTNAYTTALWTGFNSVVESNFANTFALNNITYQISSSTTVKITGYNGGATVNIPDMVTNACNTYNVTAIGNAAFTNKSLTSVAIPEGIIEIGENAFFINNLQSVTIPNSVINIEDGAFAQNNNMGTLTLGSSVESIGRYAFRYNNLNSVTIPDSVTLIKEWAFGNNNIFTLDLGNGVETINESAFSFNFIEDILIPNSVLTIGDDAFYTNSNNRNSITLGNNLTTIGDSAFISGTSSSITSITIPASVTSIGSNAFYIHDLTEVISLATTPPTINTITGTDTFGSTSIRNNITLYVPTGTVAAYTTNSGALWTDFANVNEGLPSLSNLDFDLEKNISLEKTPTTIIINSTNGVKLQSYDLYNISGSLIAKSSKNIITTNNLKSGVYILKIKFNNQFISKKIIIN